VSSVIVAGTRVAGDLTVAAGLKAARTPGSGVAQASEGLLGRAGAGAHGDV